MTQLRSIAWFTCLLLALLGCESIPTATHSDDGQLLAPAPASGLVALVRSPIPDVPMPVGFVAVAARSNSTVNADGTRVVNHTYQGRATVADAVRFYRQQLPINQWQYVREQFDGTMTRMQFVKGPEELLVEIAQPRVLDIVVRIRPRNSSGAGIKP